MQWNLDLMCSPHRGYFSYILPRLGHRKSFVLPATYDFVIKWLVSAGSRPGDKGGGGGGSGIPKIFGQSFATK